MRTLILALALLVLTACNRHDRKPDLPTADTIVQPTIVYVDRVRYVQIKPELTQEQPIAEGPLSQCPVVAKARKAALKKANSQLREIGAIEGTAVQP